MFSEYTEDEKRTSSKDEIPLGLSGQPCGARTSPLYQRVSTGLRDAPMQVY
jgi:hypothetical protein